MARNARVECSNVLQQKLRTSANYVDVMLMATFRRVSLQQRDKLSLIHKEGQRENQVCQRDPCLLRFIRVLYFNDHNLEQSVL